MASLLSALNRLANHPATKAISAILGGLASLVIVFAPEHTIVYKIATALAPATASHGVVSTGSQKKE